MAVTLNKINLLPKTLPSVLLKSVEYKQDSRDETLLVNKMRKVKINTVSVVSINRAISYQR